MTDDEREKFDAIRMTLELTGHDLESMRQRVDQLTAACEVNRVASEAQLASIRELRFLYQDVREDVTSLASSTQQLVESIKGHERRIIGLEGRIQ